MKPATLKQRADALRLPTSELARRAGVDEDNLHRIFKGKTDPRLSSLEKVEQALCEAEAEMAASLGRAIEGRAG